APQTLAPRSWQRPPTLLSLLSRSSLSGIRALVLMLAAHVRGPLCPRSTRWPWPSTLPPLMLPARHHPIGNGQSSQHSGGDACVLVRISRVCRVAEERFGDPAMVGVCSKVFRPVGQSDRYHRCALFWSPIEPAAAVV